MLSAQCSGASGAGVDRPRPDGCVSCLQLLAKGIATLVLKRYSGEEIVVIDKESGEEIVIVVRLHENHQIEVGIEASKRFDIFRREVLNRKLAAETD